MKDQTINIANNTRKKVFIVTQGCSANQADSEVMAGALKEKGYRLIDKAEDADIVVFNTCTVKGPTETEFRRKLRTFEDMHKKVVLAGCIPQSQPTLYKEYPRVGTFKITKITDIVSAALDGKITADIGKTHDTILNIPKIRRNESIEIIPISQGCLSTCTYCKTKHARGELHSYPVNEIVRHASNAVKDGAKEIWITSQDCSAYGRDIGTNLSELLKAIITIPAQFKVRVGMANPLHFDDFVNDLVEVFKSDKLYKFIHIPVQSGSDDVLEHMERGYKVADFRKIVSKFRKEIPDITLATDIICGYPTETEEDFQATMDLVREFRPDVINISKFWPRPGTQAAKLKLLKTETVKRRTFELTELFERTALEINKEWIGWKGKCTFAEKGKNDTLIGKNYAYKQILIDAKTVTVGEEIEVQITDASTYDIRAVRI